VSLEAPQAPLPAPAGALRVTERYLCAEGEGRTLGAATFLIRLSGCDLRCWWCDSKFSSFREDEAKELPWKTLLAEAKASGAAWVSFTGGEPTWRGPAELKSLGALCRALKRAGLKLKVESNGRRWLPELDGLIDLWSLAPKWDGRQGQMTELMRYELGALKRYAREAGPSGLQLKFVITYDKLAPRAADLDHAAKLLRSLPAPVKRTPVFFIPEAYAAGDYLARCRALEAAMPQLLKRLPGYDLRWQPQWHRVLHGDARGV
jgi:7-carboxy-7-deazaguanine synthase